MPQECSDGGGDYQPDKTLLLFQSPLADQVIHVDESD